MGAKYTTEDEKALRDFLLDEDCLEELFVRQCMCDKTEADDFIGYYVTHKKSNERTRRDYKGSKRVSNSVRLQ